MPPSPFLKFLELLKQCQDELHSPTGRTPKKVFELIRKFEILSGLLYLLRRTLSTQDSRLQQAEESFAALSTELNSQRQTPLPPKPFWSWYRSYRKLWQVHLSLFVFTATFFCVCTIVGWLVVKNDPAFAPALLSEQVVENILSKHKWFEGLQQNPLLGGIQIAWNNIKVCINATLLGILFGLGGIVILAFNGLMVGAILGFGATHDFEEEILHFIVGHGPLELTMIVASAFCGIIVGKAFYVRSFKDLQLSLRVATQDSLILLSGVIPWLVVAAIIEAFLSPWPEIEVSLKILIGTLAAIAFWVFSFMPESILSSTNTSESPRSSSPAPSQAAIPHPAGTRPL